MGMSLVVMEAMSWLSQMRSPYWLKCGITLLLEYVLGSAPQAFRGCAYPSDRQTCTV
jgi:hypothetical protein